MEAFLGMIMLWPMDWAPRNWALCWGQHLSIAENSALFALLGTRFGGDGTTYFCLPDLRGRVPIGCGQGIGLPVYPLGCIGGIPLQNIRLNENNLPSHSHDLGNGQVAVPEKSIDVKIKATENQGQRSEPETGDNLGAPVSSGREVDLYTSASDKIVDLSNQKVMIPAHSTAFQGRTSNTGKGQVVEINNMQPFLTINYIICTQGIFPPRS